jgi:esterase/lipase superfamily enzyme
MAEYELYYATNRNHQGKDRWQPTGYGPEFSSDGRENLRFGKVTLSGDDAEIGKYVQKDVKFGTGDGEKLAAYFAKQMANASIEAFEERLDVSMPESQQKKMKLGSARSFSELQKKMMKSRDVLIFIHGFNVSWKDAVATALSLQVMFNRAGDRDVMVVLFTWPSDGLALPLVSYKSDRGDAQESGKAFGRGLLKLRDFLAELHNRDDDKNVLCNRELHLLCHSMGNFVLQNALQRVIEFNTGKALPRILEHIFMCAPDVDDSVFEPGQPLDRLQALARSVTIYHNRGDVAMYVSDYTKSNPERLGMSGAAKPSLLHNKIHQVDCTPIVKGVVEHSYFMSGRVNDDIRDSVNGKDHDDAGRSRERITNSWPNGWRMR